MKLSQRIIAITTAILLVLFSMNVPAFGQTPSAQKDKSSRQDQKAKKVILDCDPGIDDSLAIMLALSMEELDVVGITVTAGNAPVEMGYENTLKILKFMDRLDVPVYIGADKPLKVEYEDALITHGSDGLGGSMLPNVDPSEYVKQEKSATDFLKDVLHDADPQKEAIDILALGPMTNLAILSKEDPVAFSHINELVSMGGCFKSSGNCSPVAEYNYWCDPDAAACVYKEMASLGKKIHMIGLDVTREIVLTPNLLEYMKRLDLKTGSFVEQITRFYFDFHWEWEHIIGCVINDPLAVAYYSDKNLCKGIDAYVQIETGGICRGQSVVDSMNFYRHEPNATVLTQVDKLSFFKLFFKRLLKLSGDPDLLERHRDGSSVLTI